MHEPINRLTHRSRRPFVSWNNLARWEMRDQNKYDSLCQKSVIRINQEQDSNYHWFVTKKLYHNHYYHYNLTTISFFWSEIHHQLDNYQNESHDINLEANSCNNYAIGTWWVSWLGLWILQIFLKKNDQTYKNCSIKS